MLTIWTTTAEQGPALYHCVVVFPRKSIVPMKETCPRFRVVDKSERVRKEASPMKIDDLATERALEHLPRATRLEIFEVQHQQPAFSTELPRVHPESSSIARNIARSTRFSVLKHSSSFPPTNVTPRLRFGLQKPDPRPRIPLHRSRVLQYGA